MATAHHTCVFTAFSLLPRKCLIRYLNFVEEFGGCFRGRGLALEDLTINSIEIVLCKPPELAA